MERPTLPPHQSDPEPSTVMSALPDPFPRAPVPPPPRPSGEAERPVRPAPTMETADPIWTRLRRVGEMLLALRRERRQLQQALSMERAEVARLRGLLHEREQALSAARTDLDRRVAEARAVVSPESAARAAQERRVLADTLAGVLSRVERQLAQLDAVS